MEIIIRLICVLAGSVIVFSSAPYSGSASTEIFRALIIQPDALNPPDAPDIARLAKDAGFTHLVVQLPCFRGGNDPEALAMLRKWSAICGQNHLHLVPKWLACGPTDLILSDPSLELKKTVSNTGEEQHYFISPLQNEYWQEAIFAKVAAILDDERIHIEEVCIDITMTVDGKVYNESHGYEEEFVKTFDSLLNTQIDSTEMLGYIQKPAVREQFREHVIESIARRFREKLTGLGEKAQGIRFIIDRYHDNRIYEGIARGLAGPGLPTRCFLSHTDRNYGRTELLDDLTRDNPDPDLLWYGPRLDLAVFPPDEAALAVQESSQCFGGYLAFGLDAAWSPIESLVPVQLPKASIADLIQSLATVQREGENSTLPLKTLRQIRDSAENDWVIIRGPLNRHPLFPGRNRVFFEISTILPDLRSAIVETTVVKPDLTVDILSPVTITLSNTEYSKIPIHVNVDREGWHQILSTIRRSTDGLILARKCFPIRALPVWDANLDKSYYTSENTARVRIRHYDDLPVDVLNIEATLSGNGKKIRGQFIPGPDSGIGFVDFPISSLQIGTYAVTITGQAVSKDPTTHTLQLIKRPSHSREIKFLHHRGDIIEVDGVPQFVLGAYSIGPDAFDGMSDCGVNASITGLGDANQSETINKKAIETGIGLGVHPCSAESFLTDGRDDELEQLRQLDRDAVLFYYNVDEPEVNNISSRVMKEMYDFIHTVDPYRPQVTVIYGHNQDYERFTPPYISTVDVLMMDYYPLSRGPMARFDHGMQRAVVAADERIPVWSVPQGFDWRAFSGKAFDRGTYSPSEDELRYFCYSTVTNGGRGILFWAMYVLQRNPEMVDIFKNVMKEFSSLHDVLIEEDALVRFTLEPCTGALNARGKWHEGKLYLFATNGDWFPVKAIFTFENLVPKSITEWRCGRIIAPFVRDAADNQSEQPIAGFQDEIEAVGVRVYVIEPAS
ncbi:MAG: hypothetical protein ABIH23_15015 [bacterium]